MKIGIIHEGKIPHDSRVPLTPEQCVFIQENFPVQVQVEPSHIRCFSNEEYENQGVRLEDDLSGCDVLMGVKEVPVSELMPGKTYFFFSHTIKKQAYNRKLLQAILQKRIRLIDYETLTDEGGHRVIAFGSFAGMVGAHNALWTLGERTGKFHLKRMKDYLHYSDAKEDYRTLELPPIKILLTGHGRVSTGARRVLLDLGITEVSPSDFTKIEYPFPVFTQLEGHDYLRRKDGVTYQKEDFYAHPELYASYFATFYRVADILINGIFWDNRAPQFFTLQEMRSPSFNISVIADVTCDIAPSSSIPSTLRASTIARPVYGFNPRTGEETEPFRADAVDVMAIDNLPNELCRDASISFGNQFIAHILPELLKPESEMLERATVAENGALGSHFQYLQDYVGELAEA